MNGGSHGMAGLVLVLVMVVGLLASSYLGRGALAAREGDPLEFTPKADRYNNSALAVMAVCSVIGVALVWMGGVS